MQIYLQLLTQSEYNVELEMEADDVGLELVAKVNKY